MVVEWRSHIPDLLAVLTSDHACLRAKELARKFVVRRFWMNCQDLQIVSDQIRAGERISAVEKRLANGCLHKRLEKRTIKMQHKIARGNRTFDSKRALLHFPAARDHY